MECSVCYGECGPFQKLCCGHSFCTGCLKTWYLKGTGTGCPMCRRPIYFKGFAKVRDQWDEEAWETRCSEVLSEVLDATFAESQQMAEYFPDYQEEIMEDLVVDMVDIEKTFRFLKAEGLCSEDIEYVLTETTDYYSDRNLDRVRWIDEPVKKWVSKYSQIGDPARSVKRVRARQDPWFTVSFYVEL